MRFRMLGPLEVQVDGSWSGVNAAKWRTVLAVLLLQPGQVVSTERLITEVWPEETPARATNLVSVYVHRLRRLIGDPEGKVLTTRAPGYQLLIDGEDTDAGRFARLAAEGRQALQAGDFEQASTVLGAALGLWQGTRALTDVPPSTLVSAEASRLEESRIEAVQLHIQADLGCGRHAEVVGQLHRLLADYPLREELWALLMGALYRSGRQAEALEAYAQARVVIAEELGVDPSAELQQLHQRMLQADSGSPPASRTPVPADSPFATPVPAAPVEPAPAGQAAGPPTDPGSQPETAGPDPPLPRVAQLPADIPDFTGRSDQVQRLLDLLAGPRRVGSPGAVVVAAVIGAGGLGKTTLAVHAAHLLRSQYPDGQLYANLLGAARLPVTPSEVLARFLRDLGIEPGRIPADAEERAAHYRSLLNDRKVLIVLDDAKDAAHVRPLLPGSASCAVLVTTRNRMPDLAGGRVVDLDVLNDAEAWEMFAGIIGQDRAKAEPEATGAVLTACAGLPLAIRIAGARLTARSNWTVRNLARRLADERRRLDELKTGDLAVRACFEVSFTSLPGPESYEVDPAHAFRLLGLWQGPFIGLPAAAAMIGQPEDAVADALEVLVDAQLLQAPAPDRYRFHDLLKNYAAGRAMAEESQADRDDAVSRVLTWYLHTVDAVAHMVSPYRYRIPLAPEQPVGEPLTFGTAEQALNWCETERANLVAATRQASQAGLDVFAWQLPVASLSFFNRRTYWADWVETHRIALASARRSGDRRAEALVLNNLGIGYARRHLDEAVGSFEQALDIRREIGDEYGEAQTASNLADTYSRIGRGDEALDLLKRALAIHRQAGRRYGEGVALDNLGEAYLALGRVEEAVVSLNQAQEIFASIGESRGEGFALANLGAAYLELGRVDAATDCLQRALSLRQALGDQLGEARTLRDLGHAYLAGLQRAEAHQVLAQAAELFAELGDEAQSAAITAQLNGSDG
jgi:DNA-binding SARP family transcriptional activator/Tfp pilus assembly protein PilF